LQQPEIRAKTGPAAPRSFTPPAAPQMTDRLEKRLLAEVARASHDFRLIEPGDRIMVAVSGGKDSYAMLYLLRQIQRRAPFPFSLVAVNIDQGHPGFPDRTLPDYFEREGYEYRIVKEDTYSIVKEKVPEGKTFCALCSRLRRGILYNVAAEMNCTKIALGHHRDDVIETLLLNLLYSGQMKAMPARLRSDDGRNVVIRPLVYASEAELAEFAEARAFPIIPCDLCGSQENLQRKQIKNLLTDLNAKNPKVRANVFAALGNIRPTHLYDVALRQALGVIEADETPELGVSNTADRERPPEVPLSALFRTR
jgi:tRNA 2-thiocytidine biosynthesis protein TtcA